MRETRGRAAEDREDAVIRGRELLLHPIALAAVAILIVNDHWLKYAHPSALTGKLSDFAGLTFFPLLVLIVFDLVWPRRRQATLVGAIALTAGVFMLVKLDAAATDVYRHALGFIQSPWSPSRVEAVTDPTDLVALPCVMLAFVIAYRCGFLGRRAATFRVAESHAPRRPHTLAAP
jgi:hypothetical protein